jgi:hypothetical protein
MPATPSAGDRRGGSHTGAIRIFINYRRDDTPGQAGRLYDALSGRFGEESVFMDVDKIEPGADFIRAIDTAVGSCDVLIALIGRQWLTAVDDRGRRRLDNPEDVVSIEIRAALERDIPVIPALVEGTQMPASDELPEGLAALARRNALELSDGARWRFDVERLVTFLDGLAGSATRPTGLEVAPPEPAPTTTTPIVSAPMEAGTGEGAPPKRGFGGLSSRLPRSKPVLGALAALVLALVAVGAILLTRGSGSNSTPKPAGAGAGAMAGFPDAIEDELLLAHIPESIRRSCKRMDPISAGVFLRSVSCSTNGNDVTYSRAHSGDSLRAYFLQKTNTAGVDYPTSSSCQARRPSADEWLREGVQTHVEGPSHRAEGRVLCYEDSDHAWLVWTDTPTKILGIASRPPSQWHALYGWWRTVAGPEKELAMGAGMAGKLGPYPDAIERELLLDHIPAKIRKTCKRGTEFDHDVFLRAVDCAQVPAASVVQYAYAHSGTALKSHSNDRISAAGLAFPSSQSCAQTATAADTWVRVGAIEHVERRAHNAQGRVLCFEQADTAFIEWTDVSTGIYGSASRPAAGRRALYDWWRMRAGPGALEGSGMGAMGG